MCLCVHRHTYIHMQAGQGSQTSSKRSETYYVSVCVHLHTYTHMQAGQGSQTSSKRLKGYGRRAVDPYRYMSGQIYVYMCMYAYIVYIYIYNINACIHIYK